MAPEGVEILSTVRFLVVGRTYSRVCGRRANLDEECMQYETWFNLHRTDVLLARLQAKREPKNYNKRRHMLCRFEIPFDSSHKGAWLEAWVPGTIRPVGGQHGTATRIRL